MTTMPLFIAAARQLLTGGETAPELAILAGPSLRLEQFADLGRAARAADLDIVYLAFGSDLAAGPTGVQCVFPRGPMVHVRLNGALWAPEDDGVGAIVDRQGGRGFIRFDRDELAHSAGKIAKDPRPGLRRARARLQELARSAATEPATRDVVVLRP
ncbi:hypothetical protein [Sphingomonas morindae]|uniref:Creatinase N-terminal domain-containing protein n=1 Tax=Sphingomonas morindae TaxID=1541170 RepID=A0ABY4X9F7_9SPHN|nr:hypothetical protein [Sphingomonas morindae]USI73518.1 hypothetical protein LHA26_03280 [Sphingomonas morindae]